MTANNRFKIAIMQVKNRFQIIVDDQMPYMQESFKCETFILFTFLRVTDYPIQCQEKSFVAFDGTERI